MLGPRARTHGGELPLESVVLELLVGELPSKVTRTSCPGGAFTASSKGVLNSPPGTEKLISPRSSWARLVAPMMTAPVMLFEIHIALKMPEIDSHGSKGLA